MPSTIFRLYASLVRGLNNLAGGMSFVLVRRAGWGRAGLPRRALGCPALRAARASCCRGGACPDLTCSPAAVWVARPAGTACLRGVGARTARDRRRLNALPPFLRPAGGQGSGRAEGGGACARAGGRQGRQGRQGQEEVIRAGPRTAGPTAADRRMWRTRSPIHELCLYAPDTALATLSEMIGAVQHSTAKAAAAAAAAGAPFNAAGLRRRGFNATCSPKGLLTASGPQSRERRAQTPNSCSLEPVPGGAGPPDCCGAA